MKYLNRNRLVVLLFKLLKASSYRTQVLRIHADKANKTAVAINSELSMIAFILRFVILLFRFIYRRKRRSQIRQSTKAHQIGCDLLPRSKWRNDYPIVLVHGFAGWAPDEAPMLGDYWRYASNPEISKSLDIYQADVSSVGSLHDRACELYQQMIGIQNIRATHGLDHDDNSEKLASAVYGATHFDSYHKGFQTFYKPHYLRKVKKNLDKIYAFPQGLPGGWSSHRKVHFICHSLGAPTVRHL